MTSRTKATAIVTCLLLATVAGVSIAAGTTVATADETVLATASIASGPDSSSVAPGVEAGTTAPADGSVNVSIDVRNGAVQQRDSTYVWLAGNKTVDVHVRSNETLDYSVCLGLDRDPNGTRADQNGTIELGTDQNDTAGDVRGNDTEGDVSENSTVTTIGCRQNNYVFNGYDSTNSFPIDGWPGNETGTQALLATVTNKTTGSEMARTNLSVLVVTRDGDYDSDRLSNRREAELGTGINRSDSDSDGKQDGTEYLEYGTDPLDPDTDDDGLDDGREINGKTNATLADTDGDGLEDGPEVNEYDTDPTDPDTDDDGLGDEAEVRTYETDPTDPDTDDDGLDDGREVDGPTNVTDPDTDGDGLEDGAEIKTYGTDPTDPDTDGDGLNDAHEVSMGSDPTNPLTTVFLAVAFVTVLGLVFLAYRRLFSALNPFGSGDDGGSNVTRGGGSESGDGAHLADVPEPDPVPPELLSDEDRVLQLLKESGGRLPQNEFTAQTDWSKSKVSRLLSQMDEEGEIEKIDVGRQNIIALERAVPENAKSPLEDAQLDNES